MSLAVAKWKAVGRYCFCWDKAGALEELSVMCDNQKDVTQRCFFVKCLLGELLWHLEVAQLLTASWKEPLLWAAGRLLPWGAAPARISCCKPGKALRAF